MTKRRSKTLLQQAKYYEVEGDYKEQEMMSIMESAYIMVIFKTSRIIIMS